MKKFISIVTVVTILFSASVFSQTPVLGELRKYVLFSGNGAIGNTQVSHITGEVGTNVGAITNFGNVDGKIHSVTDGSTAAAAFDLVGLNVDLASRVQTTTHAPALGTETFTPGVYDIAGNATINGTITLDGLNSANAVFIFRISGAFAVNAPSEIILTNGALACNVFWKVADVVSLYGGKMMGNIVGSAAINMSPGVTIEGRTFTSVGAINISQVIAVMPLGCGMPVLTGPAAPNLLTTKNFGLFTNTGAVANAGVSHITGDVGSNSVQPSGFNPDDVSGILHGLPDPATNQAGADLVLVYDELQSRTADIELLFPQELGFDLVLTPHTYQMTGAGVLTNNLYLNAQGNPDAVFILKVAGAFRTNTDARVILINGALAKNVYWKIDGAVDINVNSRFAGTMAVAAGDIALRTGAVLAGRALTKAGAISITSAKTTMLPDGTLPVTWASFTGKPSGETVLLEWSTVNELNNGFFTIKKSRDGRKFETLTSVPAHGVIKDAQYYYDFTDRLPYANAYYSISQTDKDGKKNEYKTIQVKTNINENFKGLHYVQQNYIYVKASGAIPGNGSMKLYNLDGRLIFSQTIFLTKDISTYKIEKSVPTGTYLIQVESNGTRLYSKKVVVF